MVGTSIPWAAITRFMVVISAYSRLVSCNICASLARSWTTSRSRDLVYASLRSLWVLVHDTVTLAKLAHGGKRTSERVGFGLFVLLGGSVGDLLDGGLVKVCDTGRVRN
jgi:hypothetical protein